MDKNFKYDWGNYLTYAKMAARLMPDNKIRNQIKRAWDILNLLIKEKEIELNKTINLNN